VVVNLRRGHYIPSHTIENGVLMLLSLMVLVSGLFPSADLPYPADSALRVALDSIDISRDQLDFDRHWASSVSLLDSTVLDCIQHIEALPAIMEVRLAEVAPLLSRGAPEYHSLDELLVLLETTACSYLDAIEETGAGRTDTLILLMSSMWADEDNPGPSGEWGAILAARGLPVADELDIPFDSLAAILESWQGPAPVDPGHLLALAEGLSLVSWPRATGIELPGIEGTILSFDRSGPVTWVIGGYGSNVYHPECSFDLIVDPSGNDVYLDGIGGAIGVLGKPVSVIVDIEGDDTWFSEGWPASQGCGVTGLGAVIDLSGRDVYRAGSLAQGSGLLGQGMLADLEGDDFMQADFFSQGAGCLGEGLLLDCKGDDTRRVSCFGQGFGGPGGLGVIVDGQGHDCNLAGFRYPHEPLLPDDNRAMSQGFAMGLRPFIAGGTGLMADFGKGNDTYRAEVFGQGSAYYYGLGLLFDEDGQDSYQAAQYSQGAGIHLAAGCLWDGGGDDSYFSRNGPAQGSAHDLSTGFLLDADGNDWYCSDGGQALSLNNSTAFFADLEGDDTYAARGGGQAEAWWGRGSSGIAVFMDLAGRDYYLGDGGDSTGWHEDYGSGIDLAMVTEVPPTTQDQIGDPGSLSLDSLFSVASEWGVSGNRDRVIAHQEELSSRGDEAVVWLLDNHLDSWDGLEMRAIEKTIRENSDLAIELLMDLLGSNTLTVRELSNTVYLLGEIGAETARIPLEEMLASGDSSNSAGRTVGIVRSLGKIGSSESLEILDPLALHPEERVRREVAVALGAIGDISAMPILELLAEDESVAVRSAAESAIGKLEEMEQEPEDS
jgi:HEAT repeat protein